MTDRKLVAVAFFLVSASLGAGILVGSIITALLKAHS